MLQGVLAQSNSLYIGDMLFYIVSFIILMLLVKHYAWKPVTDMMNKRATKISDDIDNAEKSRAEAEKLAAQRQTELQNSHQEAAKIISTAKRLVKLNGTRSLRMRKRCAGRKRASPKDAEQARRDALKGRKTMLPTYLLRLLPSSSTRN